MCANNGIGLFSFSAEKKPGWEFVSNRASFLLGNFDGHVFDRKFHEFGLQSLARLLGGSFQHFSLLSRDLAVGDELVDLLFDKNSSAGGVAMSRMVPTVLWISATFSWVK